MDGGYPANTETAVLQDLILPVSTSFPSVAKQLLSSGTSPVSANLPQLSTSAISWRKSGVRYTNNEIFFDQIEDLDCIVDCSGAIVSCDITGKFLVQCRLSGLPDLTLIFENPHLLDEGSCSFHPCVRYARFENERVVSFIPPDGHFELMKYRVMNSSILSPPIQVRPQFSFNHAAGSGRISVMLSFRNPHSGSQSTDIDDLVILIPLPSNVDSVSPQTSHGIARLDPVKRELKWDLGHISSKQTPSLNCTVVLTPPLSRNAGGMDTVSDPGGKGIQVQFSIKGITMSGLKVNSVKLLNETYKIFKGLRSFVKSGKYIVRTV